MKVLTSLYGAGANSQITVSSEGMGQELPFREVTKLLWAYYLNNGLYDELRMAGYFLDEVGLRSLRNPAQRVVKFYTDSIWPGSLPQALPLDLDTAGAAQLADPIAELWKWSNFQMKKQTLVRWTSVLGEGFIKVAQPAGKDRVYLQMVKPDHVTDFDEDEQGNIIWIRSDVPRHRRTAGAPEFYLHTEIWSKADGNCKIWEHTKSPETPPEQLGLPSQMYELKEWGIDFIPWVRAVHMDIGEPRGVGAFILQLDKIDEANRQASRLHSMIFRKNDVTWALEANMVDSATGRPLPPPNIGTGVNDDGDETVDLSGEKMIRLPGLTKLTSLVPNINYDAALAVLNAHMVEVKSDLPELRYFDLPDLGELSGRAIRLLMNPAVTSAQEVRGNLESALVRAQMMAFTIGQNTGIWKGLGSYEDGDLEHGFQQRAIIPMDRYEQGEITKLEREAGIPLFTSLRRSGVSEEEQSRIEEDASRSASMAQAGMGAAMAEATAEFDAGSPGVNGQAIPPNAEEEEEEEKTAVS